MLSKNKMREICMYSYNSGPLDRTQLNVILVEMICTLLPGGKKNCLAFRLSQDKNKNSPLVLNKCLLLIIPQLSLPGCIFPYDVERPISNCFS